MKIEYIGSKYGYSWYEMTWMVNDSTLISIDTWYTPIESVFEEFMAEASLRPKTIEDVKLICDKIVDSLKYVQGEDHIRRDYEGALDREGDFFYLDLLKKFNPKTNEKVPLRSF